MAAVKPFIAGQCQASCERLGCCCYLLRHEALPRVSVSPTDCCPELSLKMEINNRTPALVEIVFFSPHPSPFLPVPREQNPEQSDLHGHFLLVLEIVLCLLHNFRFMLRKIL